MLKSLALIFVYRGNVGGRILWFTVGENPIGFGASSKEKKNSLVFTFVENNLSSI